LSNGSQTPGFSSSFSSPISSLPTPKDLDSRKRHDQKKISSSGCQYDGDCVQQLLRDIEKIFNSYGSSINFDYPDLLQTANFFFHDPKFKLWIISSLFSYLERQNIPNFDKDEFKFIFINMIDLYTDSGASSKKYKLNFSIAQFITKKFANDIDIVLNLTSIFDSQQTLTKIIKTLNSSGEKDNANYPSYSLLENSYPISGIKSMLRSMALESKKSLLNTAISLMTQ
jgi:hypothetical protein